jgi:hypothetical protein
LEDKTTEELWEEGLRPVASVVELMEETGYAYLPNYKPEPN